MGIEIEIICHQKNIDSKKRLLLEKPLKYNLFEVDSIQFY